MKAGVRAKWENFFNLFRSIAGNGAWHELIFEISLFLSIPNGELLKIIAETSDISLIQAVSNIVEESDGHVPMEIAEWALSKKKTKAQIEIIRQNSDDAGLEYPESISFIFACSEFSWDDLAAWGESEAIDPALIIKAILDPEHLSSILFAILSKANYRSIADIISITRHFFKWNDSELVEKLLDKQKLTIEDFSQKIIDCSRKNSRMKERLSTIKKEGDLLRGSLCLLESGLGSNSFVLKDLFEIFNL